MRKNWILGAVIGVVFAGIILTVLFLTDIFSFRSPDSVEGVWRWYGYRSDSEGKKPLDSKDSKETIKFVFCKDHTGRLETIDRDNPKEKKTTYFKWRKTEVKGIYELQMISEETNNKMTFRITVPNQEIELVPLSDNSSKEGAEVLILNKEM